MSTEQNTSDKSQSNILLLIIHRYLPYWPIFILTTTISLSFAFVYLRSQTRIYVAAAKVLLKDPQKSGGDSKVLDQLNIFTEKKIVENEIIVLRSTSLVQQVVKTLDLYCTVYNEGRVQTEELYKDGAPLRFIALNKDSINYGGKIFFSIIWDKREIKIQDKIYSFDSTININNTVYRILINPTYNTKITGKNFFAVFNTAAGAAGGIIGSIKASPLSYSSTVLDVKMETPVPEKGIDVLNKLFEVYNTEGIEDKNIIATNTLRFIDDRLNIVINQLDSVERKQEASKKEFGVTDLGSQASLYFQNVKELDKKKSELDLQLEILDDIKNYINAKGRKPGTVPSLLMVNDPILASLLQQLYSAEFEWDKIKSITGERSESVINAEEKVSRIKNDIRENLNNIRNSYTVERNALIFSIAKNSDLLREVPSKERALLEIGRQQQIKNNIYTYLLTKREETALASASTSADLRILENGYSYGPISPIPKNYYLIGFLVGLITFILYVQIQEQLINKVLFRKEIENKTNIPVVAEIIQTQNENNIAISQGKRTVVAEQFRTLRTNLGFIGLNNIDKTILITSSISGEGKSFIATNLALSITLNGKKVALMELDLRKPKLSRQLKVEKNPGISSYLIGKATLDEITKPTAYENLFLVTAGPIPPNPTELIALPAFKEMLDELKSKFDYVIIDTAPIGPVTDAQLLTQFAETTIFVVRHAVTPTVFLKMIDNLNREQKFRKMCIVFNGIKPRGVSLFNYGFGGYGNGYGYGYGYGHGYGYGYGSSASGYYTTDTRQPGFKNLWGVFTGIGKYIKKLKQKDSQA